MSRLLLARPLLLAPPMLLIAALGGCKSSEPTSAEQSADREAPAAEAPDINIKAAPGVAFAYRYDFVVPDSAISAVQEAHASACEKLGPGQCRITGMRYSLLDEEKVSAQLQFKLAPQLARSFGKEGMAAIEKAAGKLVDAQIDGDDVAPVINAARTQGNDAVARLAAIEARLKAGGLGDEARSELESQAATLRDQIASAKASQGDAQAQLASTPMTFNYAGDASFTLGGNPLGEALRSGWSSFSSMIWFVLMTIGLLLPWAVLLALLTVGWRSRPGLVLRRFLRGKNTQEEVAEG